MLYSLYKDAYISQLVRVMDTALKDRNSFKQIKRADRLRSCRKQYSHLWEWFKSNLVQGQLAFRRGTTGQCTQSSKLSEMKLPLWQPWRRGQRPLGWTSFPYLKTLLYGPRKVHCGTGRAWLWGTAGNQGPNLFFLPGWSLETSSPEQVSGGPWTLKSWLENLKHLWT